MYNLTYKIKENGYEIYNDGKLWITQYEPYIPNKSLSYEENAKLQIEELNTVHTVDETQDIEPLKMKVTELEAQLSELKTILSSLEEVSE